MAEIKSELKRGRSNYSIELTGMEKLHPSGAGIVNFQISARDGQKEIVLASLPITVHAGPGGLDAMAARACKYMGDALHKMLGIVDDLQGRYNKKK
jgi:hypothetical protein